MLADGKSLWRSLAKANAARRSKTKKDMQAKLGPYRGNGRRTPGVPRTRTAAGKTRPKQAARREQGRVACARGVAAAGLFCRSSHGGLSPAHVVRCNVCHRTASRSPRGPCVSLFYVNDIGSTGSCFLMNSLSVCVKSLSLFSLSRSPHSQNSLPRHRRPQATVGPGLQCVQYLRIH